VSSSTPVEVQSQFFSTNGEKTITSSSGQGVVLKGIVIMPSPDGAYDDDRNIDFFDNVAGGPSLFRFFNKGAMGGAGSLENNTGYCTTIDIPLMGIRFPNGIKFTINTDYVEQLAVFYTG